MGSNDWCPVKSVKIDGHACIEFSGSEISTYPLRDALVGSAPKHDGPVVLIGAGGRSTVGKKPAGVAPLGSFEDRRSQHFDRIIDDLKYGTLRSSSMTGDVRVWFVQRAQSVNPYQVEKDNLRGEIDAVLQLLHAVDERIAASDLQIDGAQRVFLKVADRMVELGELSSGFASILKLFQSIISAYSNFTNSKDLRHVPGVIIIDEIESHLHVSWQTTVIHKLKELFPNSALVVATHSPLVLTQLRQGEAYLLEREPDGVVRSSVIDSPNMKAFADVLEETFGVDLNALKRNALVHEDQREVKQALLDLAKRNRQKRSSRRND
ncbi:hypothetical protein B8X02_11595 [Stenotrophomonas rhizophila]|nr:hypothetical protein B8X02_11595 [Stenotrophomonas rhizophila]